MRHTFVALVLGAGAFVACGSDSENSGRLPSSVVGDGVDASTDALGDAADAADDCAGKDNTSLTGKVYDPGNSNALYNVMVYIPGGPDPDGPLPPFKDASVSGVACETCASVALNPFRSALTDATGTFKLDDVPVGDNLTLVAQIGKWRRRFHVNVPKKCEANVVPDHDLRLPKMASEGDMPQIAVTTGACDELECLLRGIGIDDSEFVLGHGGAGHVHLFAGDAGKIGPSASDELWNSAAALKKYDQVLLGCECGESLQKKGGTAPGARAGMVDYLNAGGRVLFGHYQYAWIKESPNDAIRAIATFGKEIPVDGFFDVNTTFPKGAALASWLTRTAASTTPGKLAAPSGSAYSSVSQLQAPAVGWLAGGDFTKSAYFSFNTPVTAPAALQCGRAAFTDIHGAPPANSGPVTAITQCSLAPGKFSAQQKAAEFIFFDLGACVQDDTTTPTPPK